jgi:hypothetical protein
MTIALYFLTPLALLAVASLFSDRKDRKFHRPEVC